MAGNDDLASIDETVAEFKHVRNPDMKRFELEGGYELVGNSNANMTPWACARDIEEDELTKKMDDSGRDDPKSGTNHRSFACSSLRIRPGYLPGTGQEPEDHHPGRAGGDEGRWLERR